MLPHKERSSCWIRSLQRDSVQYSLSLDSNFAPFLADNFTWLKTSSQAPPFLSPTTSLFALLSARCVFNTPRSSTTSIWVPQPQLPMLCDVRNVTVRQEPGGRPFNAVAASLSPLPVLTPVFAFLAYHLASCGPNAISSPTNSCRCLITISWLGNMSNGPKPPSLYVGDIVYLSDKDKSRARDRYANTENVFSCLKSGTSKSSV